jgi:phosphatidylglycerol:prolipoprotein diacylglycerol transferase
MNYLLAVKGVAFTIGKFDVYWYGIIISLSIVVAVAVATFLCKLRKYNTDMPLNIALVILPTGILCARLFAVLFDSSMSIAEFFDFRSGGMSIIGAVIGGGLGLLVFLLLKKEKDMLRYFDTLTVVLILAQAIGRWGNYCNGEVYGQVVDASSKWATFPFAVAIDGVFYQALFFYEFVLNMIGFVILAILFLKTNKSGYVTSAYLIYYGIVRTILEPLRAEKYILKLAGLPISQVCSIIMIVGGVAMLVYTIYKTKKSKEVGYEQKVKK